LTNKSVDAAGEKIGSNAGCTYLALHTTSMKEYTSVQKNSMAISEDRAGFPPYLP
jgi:hypothetical protein